MRNTSKLLTQSLHDNFSTVRIEHNLSQLSNNLDVLILKPITLCETRENHCPNHLTIIDF